ncbi:SRPBCC family protein [Nocardiopsis sp. RSe5-2]|uniref:SRPBCC family protein n=1 Tax=Nocardiopsis endophytica TaxID=3018445 RepID=A0ABT4U9A4_9ACTN|nr:SRPBCC family protein [Nocardiopsis endophytica]MDA2813543.1 SRPBCC family protein [Nocardiopsis endophytica]
MDGDAFEYTAFIGTGPERLWRGLTDPELTRRYWGAELRTDWHPGSTITWVEHGAEVDHPEQVVLAAEPHRRLSYTWHTFTPEWAEAVGVSEDLRSVLAAETRSKATFTIDDLGPVVRLKLVHDGFDPGSTVLEMLSEGWPAVLSSLKTLLETGEPLPEPVGAGPDEE